MAVDDAGLRRRQSGDAGKLRLERARGIAADHLQAFNTVGQSLREQRFDLGQLVLVGGDDQLAALVVRNSMRGAEVIEHASAAHAVLGARGVGRIIDAGVNDLAVARRHSVADSAGRLGDDHIVACERRRTGDRKSDNARADDQDLHAFNLIPILYAARNRNGGNCRGRQATGQPLRMRKVVATSSLCLPSRTSPVWASRPAMLTPVSGSVQATTKMSPACMAAIALRVRSTGS